MKKNYPKVLIILILLLMHFSLSAQLKVLNEDFEGGGIPQGWTQEYETGNISWTIETGTNLVFPNGTVSGTSRARFSGVVGAAAKTKLLTLFINISSLDQEFMLTYYYAMEQLGASQLDTLRIYYRTSESSSWNLAKQYDTVTSYWTSDTILLIKSSNQIQFAFEGSNGGGHGVVLDDIILGNRPLCSTVRNLRASNIKYSTATLSWQHDNDIAEYHVKVDVNPIDNNSTGLIFDQRIDGLVVNLSDLQPGTTYYYSVKSDCGDDDEGEWASGSFKTGCAPVETLNEDFESYEANEGQGGVGFGCWTNYIEISGTPTVTNAYYPYINNSATYASSGTKSLRLYGLYASATVSSTTGYAVSPALADTVDLKTKQLSFSMYSANKNYHLRIGISKYSDNLTNYEEIEVITCENPSIKQNRVVYLNNYTGNGKYIVFSTSGEDGKATSTIYIDDIKLEPINSCEDVRITDIDVVAGTNNAVLTWNAVNTTQWQLKVSNRSIDPEAGEANILDSIITTNPYTITGLYAGQQYYYYIRPVCSESAHGKWSPEGSFITGCDPMGITTFPYRESFDIWGTGTSVLLPACWRRIVEGSTSYINTTHYSAPASLYFSHGTLNAGSIIIITPKMDLDLNKLRVSFMASGTRDHFMIIGAFPEEKENPADFVPIDTVYITASSTGTWEKFTVDLTGYKGPDRCIAFMTHSSTPLATRNFQLDDLVIEEIKDCNKPEGFVPVEVKTNSVSLKWEKGGNESAWNITYVKKGNIPKEGIDPVKEVNETNITINNELLPNTNYDFYVRADCGEGNLSDWVGPLSIFVPQAVASIPYSTAFEDEKDNNQWTFLNGTYVNKWRLGSTDLTNGKSLYVSSNGIENNYVNTTCYLYAYRKIDFSSGKYDINFQWKAQGESTNDFLKAFLVPDDITITESNNNGISATATPEGWICLSDEKLNLSSEWNKHTYTGIVEEGIYKLVFYWVNNASTNNPPAAIIDSIIIAENKECMTPVVHISKILDTSVQFNFADYNSTSWKLKVSETDVPVTGIETANGWVFDDILTSTQCLLPELKPATTYYYYLKSDCAEEWLKGSFTTRCARTGLPFIEGFDAYSTSGALIPDCWSRMRKATSGTEYPSIVSTNYKGGRSLQFTVAANQYVLAVTPILDVDNFQGKQLSFYGRVTVLKHMAVGIMEDADDLDSFELIENVVPSATGTWEYFEIPLDSYNGQGKFVAFLLEADATATFYIDELIIEQAPPCRNPSKLTVTDISSATAELTWKGFTSSYNVKVSSAPFLNETDTGNVFNGIVQQESLSLTNLKGPRIYYWAVQAICDDNVSNWMYGAAFKTECPVAVSIPYRENFDNMDKGASCPDCWNEVRNYGGTLTQITSQYYHSIPHSFQMYSSSTAETIFATPELDIESISDLTVSFRGSISSSSKLIVGVITDIDKPYTFTAVDTVAGESLSEYDFYLYSVNMKNYNGTGKYVAFKTIVSYAARIDDIYIYRTDAYRSPTQIFVTNITDTSARLSWIEPEPMPEYYRMKVSGYPIIPETEDADVAFLENIPRASQNLTALLPNTTYYVYIQGIYAGDEEGEWSEGFVFETMCPVQSLPYKELFDTYGGTGTDYFPSCWKYNFGVTGSIYNTDYVMPYIYADGINGSYPASLTLRSAYYTVYSQLAYLTTDVIMPPFDVDSIQKLQISFRYKSPDQQNVPIIVGVMTDYIDQATFVAVDTFYTNLSTNWSAKCLVSFAGYEGNGRYIAFRADPTIFKQNRQNIRIDDIYVNLIPDCAPPSRISGSATDTTLTFTWNAGNANDTEWIYMLTDSLITLPEDLTDEELIELIISKAIVSGTVNINSCRIDEVTEPNTTYYFYVASACKALYPGAYEISTLCRKEPIPYREDFKGYGITTSASSDGLNTKFPDCWVRMDDIITTIARPYITEVKGDTMLALYGSSNGYCLAVTPEMDTERIQYLRARFKALKTSTTDKRFIVGIMTNPTDTSTFVPVDTIVPQSNGDVESFRVSFENYEGSGKYVAFYVPKGFSASSEIYIGDIIIEEIMDCDIPENINIIRRMDNGFEIGWNKKTADKWEIRCGLAGFDINDLYSDTILVQTPAYVATGLFANTLYDVYVRAVCGEEEQSGWSEKLTIRTLQADAETIPFLTGFEVDSLNQKWTLDNGSAVNTWVIGHAAAMEAGASGLYISNNGGGGK